MKFSLECSAFSNRDPIPSRFSGEGENISPPLSWSNAPANAVEFALICEDPDAPGEEPFVHWLIYNIPRHVTTLLEGIVPEAHLVEPLEANQGRNSSGEIGYTGPMPPVGHGKHHYHFKLLALSEKLDLTSALEKAQLLEAFQGKVIGQAELIGVYERRAAKKSA